MTMGSREIAHRAYKAALDARSEAQKLFGSASAQYAFANASHSDAISKLPRSLDANMPTWKRTL